MNNLFSKEAREFNSYDATVAKTSLKIASLSLFFIIMLICITFESSWDYTGAEFRGVVSKPARGIQSCGCVFTFFAKLEKRSFHVVDLPRTGNRCTEIKKAREGRFRPSCFG